MSNKVCNKLCVNDAITKIKDTLSNKIHTIELNKNKGIVGHYIETSIGLTLNSDCLDLIDGEIKAFPLKQNKKSKQLVPKETIAITMTDRESLKKDDFNNSRLYKKIETIIFVPYLRKSTKVLIFEPILIKINDNIDIYNKIKKDYDDIKNKLLDINQIQSKIGDYIQSRTKGPKKSDTRAYYFKTNYIREYIIPNLKYDTLETLINEIIM
jgi:DNA mismatch repair protein MutH